VVPLYSAPLRERTDDIPVLLSYYLDYFCREMKKPKVRFSEEALDILTAYQWKGNVRELKNLCERLVVFAEGPLIPAGMLPEEIKRQENWSKDLGRIGFQEAKRAFEREYLVRMLKKNEWNISATAEEIRIARKNLQLKMKQLNIKKE
jgi:DNA-binding NtrC family response regulator